MKWLLVVCRYQQSNEFAQGVQRNDGEEHYFQNGEGSSGSDSEMARIHNEQEVVWLKYRNIICTFFYFVIS